VILATTASTAKTAIVVVTVPAYEIVPTVRIACSPVIFGINDSSFVTNSSRKKNTEKNMLNS